MADEAGGERAGGLAGPLSGAYREIELADEVDHPDADIVFLDGQSAQWPRGAGR